MKICTYLGFTMNKLDNTQLLKSQNLPKIYIYIFLFFQLGTPEKSNLHDFSTLAPSHFCSNQKKVLHRNVV